MLPDLALFGSSAPAAVRRPLFEIAFGSARDGGGGPGGLMSAAASAIGLTSGTPDSWKRSVARIVVERGLAPEVDRVEITLAADSQAPAVALGDEGTISLGYDDEGATLVNTGHIESIRRDVGGALRIAVANGTASLAGLRRQQSFENQSASDVVKELASQAGVAAGDIAAGSDLPFVVLDSGRSAWEHIARLARVSGHLARVNADGELDVGPPDHGEPVQTFTRSVDIIALHRTETEPAFDAVSVTGEGAAGSRGSSAWNWLVKQPAPITGSAGSGERTRAFADRALRSAAAVQAAAQSLSDAAARAALTGTLQVPGAPAVAPGLRIEIAGTAGGEMDGEFLIVRVRHAFDKRAGFRSRIDFAGPGGGGGGLGGLLEGLL